jgi:(methylthio)acryloyl-CoA hydratase
MAEELIKTRIEGELAYIGLNRPEKRNAVSGAMLEALPRALMEVSRAEVRAVI